MAEPSTSNKRQREETELLGHRWMSDEVDVDEIALKIDGFFDTVADYDRIASSSVENFQLLLALNVLNRAVDLKIVDKDVPPQVFYKIVEIFNAETSPSSSLSVNFDIFTAAGKFLVKMAKAVVDSNNARLAEAAIQEIVTHDTDSLAYIDPSCNGSYGVDEPYCVKVLKKCVFELKKKQSTKFAEAYVS